MGNQRPIIGVTVLILKDQKVLLGLRKGNKLANEMFGSPGGHIEHLESCAECAKREVAEETGLEIVNLEFVCVTNVRDFAPAHYLMVVLRADWKDGEPVLCEPEKCEGWGWYSLNNLPDPLTPATKMGIKALQSGQALFD